MQTTKFKLDVLKPTDELKPIAELIHSHNEGKSTLCLNDFISYGNCQKALLPTLRKGLLIYRSDDDNSLLFVSDDDGDSVALTIQEIELHELEQVNDIPEDTFISPGAQIGDN